MASILELVAFKYIGANRSYTPSRIRTPPITNTADGRVAFGFGPAFQQSIHHQTGGDLIHTALHQAGDDFLARGIAGQQAGCMAQVFLFAV